MTRAREHLLIVAAAAVILSVGRFAAARDMKSHHTARIRALGAKFLARGFQPSWSPDGKRIVFARGVPRTKYDAKAGLAILDTDTGKSAELVKIGANPAWSPKDGKLIAYVRSSGPRRRDEEIWVVAAAGGEPRKIADGGFPSWSADGKTLFYHCRKQMNLMAIDTSAANARPKVIASVPFWYPAVSLDGKQVAFLSINDVVIADTKTGKTLRTWPISGGKPGLLGGWSPDGKYFCFGRRESSDHAGLWMVDVRNGRRSCITAGPFTMPAWSRDGKKIAFDRRTETGGEIWTIDAGASASLSVRTVARIDSSDRVELLDGKVLLGAIGEKQFALTAFFGKINIPASSVAGLVPGSRAGQMRLLLSDSQILTGKLETETLEIVTDAERTVRVPLTKITECGWRITKDKPYRSKPAAGATIEMRNGDRLHGKLIGEKLALKTEFGVASFVLAGAKTFSFDRQTPGVLIVKTFDGTTLRGRLAEETLAAAVTIGAATVTVKIPAKDIAIVFRQEP
ncbi:MAG: hypothetical protein QGG42_00075 [Phycisphaerae bacterium]|jgi:hypothetical protein|nr:hypothetical protein [Phycisphaerae bacterium]